MGDVYEQSLALHEEKKGKLGIVVKVPVEKRQDLTLAYTPGVAEPCRRIAKNPDDIYRYTIKSNSVAVITDGTAVLGLGNIGAAAGLPVMEGKALLFKTFADIDAYPICVKTQNPEEFIMVVKNIAAGFGGINLEDIAAPNCFVVEKRLRQELDIPVFHDDQHGTAIVVLAAMINAFKIAGLPWGKAKVVVSGAGAAGVACSKLLLSYGLKNIVVCDRNGAIEPGRNDIKDNFSKIELANITNPNKEKGSLEQIVKGANVFLGVSAPGLLKGDMVKTMASNPVIFAMANPMPEIMPDEAKAAGAFIVCTGRSDFPNQVNNVLAFPGVFRGILDIRYERAMKGLEFKSIQIDEKMKMAAAIALASLVKEPSPEKIIPGVFEDKVADVVAEAVKGCV